MHLTDRIEMIGGRVYAAGSAEGSFQLLKVLLESWTAHAALAFENGDFDPWVKALADHCGVGVDEIERRISADPREPLSGRLDYSQLFPDMWPSNRRMLGNLLASADQSNLRFAGGPGRPVRIGENAPTPDFVIAQNGGGLRPNGRCLEGVPEIVLETVVPRRKDLSALHQIYANHGIPELWVVDLEKRDFCAFENRDGSYRLISRLNAGIYSSAAVGGLDLNVDRLWDLKTEPVEMFGVALPEENGNGGRHSLILNYAGPPPIHQNKESEETVGPLPPVAAVAEPIPFRPRIGYRPEKITCDEFLSWNPAPEFRIDGNRLLIENERGTRNVIGMLLQTLGLKNAVAALPADDWITAIAERRLQIKSCVFIQKYMAREAREAADLLREQYGRRDLRTYGWLDEPPGMWTRVRIVDMEAEDDGAQTGEIRKMLGGKYDDVEFTGAGQLSPAERQQIENRSLRL